MKTIEIYNARIHNLKNIFISIPKDKFIVVTGVSGSGKSSFVFDTIFEEGRKLYLESIGMFTTISENDSFDSIQGLTPTIATKQRTINQLNPRSVVGTKTRILNLLAILYAKLGQNSGCSLVNNKKYRPGYFIFETTG